MVSVQRRIAVLGALGAVIALLPAELCAQVPDDLVSDPAPQVVVGVETELASRYLDRGLTYSDGAVSQTSLWVSAFGLTGSIWTNYEFDAEMGTPSLNEVDIALAWSGSLGLWDLEPSVQTFSYPEQPDVPWTAEILLSLTCNLPVVQPYAVYRLDVKEYAGACFGELGVQTGWALRENLELGAQASLGWGSSEFNQAYLGKAFSGLQVAMLDAGVLWNAIGGLYVRPHLVVAALLRRDARELVEDPSPLQAGLVVGGEF